MNRAKRMMRERPFILGLLVSGVVFLAAAGVGLHIVRGIDATRADERAVSAELADRMTAQRRAREDHLLARRMYVQMDGLCGRFDPVVQALVLTTNGWPGLTMVVAGSAPTPTDPATKPNSSGVHLTRNGVLLTLTGSERAVMQFLLHYDSAASLATSVLLTHVDRSQDSNDTKAPAQRDLVRASVMLDAFRIDPQLCSAVRRIAYLETR